jgi:hypothetical protein
MSSGRTIGIMAFVVVVAAFAFGFLSDHARAALHAIHLTHNVWFVAKIGIVAVSAIGFLAVRIYKALRPAEAANGERGPDGRPHAVRG